MGAIAGLIAQFGAWIGGRFLADYSLRVAVIAAALGTFSAIWIAITGLLSVASSALVGVFGVFPAFLLQFFPDASAIGLGVGSYLSTLGTLRVLDYWRHTVGVVAQVK